jgi:hypothetical protein
MLTCGAGRLGRLGGAPLLMALLVALFMTGLS